MIGSSPVWNNLPRPKVTMINNHPYISTRQYVLQFFASDIMPQNVSKDGVTHVTSLSDYDARKEVYASALQSNPRVPKDNLLALMGIIWSDDFDPNLSIKANRGAVWIGTVTFISELFADNTLEDTYNISIGLKNQYHDVIERKFVTELEELKNGKITYFFNE